jgi:hypothetical protein
MLIVEELFLLLRRDDGTPESMSAPRGYGLAAAVITDLVLAEQVTLSDDKDPRVSVLGPRPLGHPALDAAMIRLRERDGTKLSSLVADRKLAVEEQTAQALAAAGVVRTEAKRAWGLVPAKYPVLDPGPERRVREHLRVALAGATPRTEDATLLAILHALGVAPKVLEQEKGTLGRRDLEQRIKEISAEVEAGDAVSRAVATMNSAIPVIISDGGGDGGDGGGGGD